MSDTESEVTADSLSTEYEEEEVKPAKKPAKKPTKKKPIIVLSEDEEDEESDEEVIEKPKQKKNAKKIQDVVVKAPEKPVKIKARGSRLEVYQGLARQTTGGLKIDDLFERNGNIVSKKASECSRNLMMNRKGKDDEKVSVKKAVRTYEKKVKDEPKELKKSKKSKKGIYTVK